MDFGGGGLGWVSGLSSGLVGCGRWGLARVGWSVVLSCSFGLSRWMDGLG